MSGQVAVARHGKLHARATAGTHPPEQVARAGALRHFIDQPRKVRGVPIGMDQRRVRSKRTAAAARQRRHAGKHAVLVWRKVQQHHGQGGLVQVLGPGGTHPHAHGATPVGDLGQLGGEHIQQRRRLGRVVVGDIEQAQGGRGGVPRQSHLRAQLRQHQGHGHAPLRMGGMGGGKSLHGPSCGAGRCVLGSTLNRSSCALPSWPGCAWPVPCGRPPCVPGPWRPRGGRLARTRQGLPHAARHPAPTARPVQPCR